MTKSKDHAAADVAVISPHFEAAPFRKALVQWYQANERPLPWRDLWRRFQNPYHIWVSEVMLQQTVIAAVIPSYERFLAAFPTLWDLAQADEAAVRQAVRGLGYYRRFRLLHAGAKMLAPAKPEAAVVWPQSFGAWKAVPGVGAYTAAAIASIAFAQAKAVVDGNVERVFCRLFDLRLPSNLPVLKKRFQECGDQLIDLHAPGAFNQGLMELGQRVCTVTKPGCEFCPLRSFCLAFSRKSVALAPAAKLKKAVQDLNLRLTIVEHKGKVCLQTRPKDARFLKDSQGFLTSIKDPQVARSYRRDGSQNYPSLSAVVLEKVGLFKHSITHHRLAVEVCVAKLKQLPGGPRAWSPAKGCVWLDPAEVEAGLLANLDGKAWRLLQKYTQRVRDRIPPLTAGAKPSRVMAEKPLF